MMLQFQRLILRSGQQYSIRRRSSHFPDAFSPTNLDRLLRYKPAISHEDDDQDNIFGMGAEEYMDGIPDERGDLKELGDDPENPLFKVGKSLLKLGKVHYRHIESLPDWMIENQEKVCSHRTPAQIRRCLANWMIQPDRELQQRYRNRKLTWRLNVKEGSSDQQMNKIMTYGPEETVAYSAYFMPSRFQITKRVFKEIHQLVPSFKPTRMIDFGCGPGTAACAAAEVWNTENDTKLVKYTGIDMSRAMLDAAKMMIADKVPDCVFWDRTVEVVKKASTRGDRFDMAISSFTLTELANDPTRRAAVQLMYELLDVGGMLVIIEAGNPFGSHTTRTARQFILDTFGASTVSASSSAVAASIASNVSKGKHAAVSSTVRPPPTLVLPAPPGHAHADLQASVVSPCTHDQACPLAQGVWCSFSQRVHSAMIRKGFEEKFSFVVIQKARRATTSSGGVNQVLSTSSAFDLQLGGWISNAHNRTQTSSQNSPMTPPSPLQILSQAVEQEPEEMPQFLDKIIDDYDIDWETYTPPLRREEWGRVVRSPIKGKGHVTMDLCVPSGVLTRSVLSRGNMLQMPTLYSAMRKTTWGGLFPVLLEEEERSPLMIKSAGAVSRVFRGDQAMGSSNIKTNGNRGRAEGGEEDEEEKEDRKRRIIADQVGRARKAPTNTGGATIDMRKVREAISSSTSKPEPEKRTGRRSGRLAAGLSRLSSSRQKADSE